MTSPSTLPRLFRLLLCGAFCLSVMAVDPAWGADAAPVDAAPEADPAPEEQQSGIDITARSQDALATLDRLKSELGELGNAEKEEERLAALRSRVDDLLPEGETLEDLALDVAEMDGIAVRSRTVTGQAAALINKLTQDAKALEELKAEARSLIAVWRKTQTEAEEMPQALSVRVADILKRAEELESEVNSKLNEIIELQNRSMEVRNLITPIAERIDSYGKSQQTRMFERNVEPIWALTTEHISESSERSGRRFTGSFQRDFVAWRETSEAAIGGHLLILPLLMFLLFKLKAVAEAPSSALARPAATAVLIWLLIGVAVYAGAPQTVRLLFVITTMLVAAVVLLHSLPPPLRKGVVAFIVIALVQELVQGQPVVEHLPRVIYLVLGIALVVLAWLSRRAEAPQAFVDWGAPQAFIISLVNAVFVIMVISVVANSLGYVVLGKRLATGVVDSSAVLLILFAGFSSISEIIQLVLGLPALDGFRSISANRYRLRWVLRKPLVWLSLILWGWATLVAFGVDDWLIGSIQKVFQAEIALGDLTLSLRGIIVFGFAVWAAVWISRIVRAVLTQDVLPRLDLPRGVPNTISMTVHYTIMLVGLLLGVGYIGLDLSNLAIVVGALGVGIGFGLQNLVNNFVSGLILIFEAPIQVGDTVEVGNLMGRVVQIGIRTSRVRTYSGSEVIVPNGDLVSNQVINWTLSDRRRRLELSVGVAYGTDPELVTSTLRAVFEADEDVLKDPAPLIVFIEFADSSLNFKMYVWIADFDTGFGMTHRLNTAINTALQEAGITIPFPQRDLHVKTLPEGNPGAEQAEPGPLNV